MDSQVKPGSERSFAVVLTGVLVLVALFPMTSGGAPWLWLLVIAATMALIGWFRPHWLHRPNLVWFRFGLMLGAVMSPVIMFLVYALTVVPTGLLLRALGKRPLDLAMDSNVETYWKPRDHPPESMKEQY